MMRPVWANDGSSIYYLRAIRDTAADLGRRFGLHRARPDGTGTPEEVDLPAAGEVTLSPDGEWWIYRTPNVPDDPDLMAVPADALDSDPIALAATQAEEGEPTLSRDGRWLAYSSNEGGVGQVYVRGFPDTGSRVPITSEGGLSPVFSPGTDELFVVEDGWMVAYAYVTDPSFRVVAREPLFDVSAYVISDRSSSHNFDVDRNGQRFVMVRRVDPSSDSSSEIMLRLDYLPTLSEGIPR